MIDLSNRGEHTVVKPHEEDNCASQTSTTHRDRIRKLKSENLKLYQLLNETEDSFKNKIEQTRKESQNIMKIIGQILPYVRKALKQNHNDQDAKDLIRQIELNAFTTSGATTAEEVRNFSLSNMESEQSKSQVKSLQNRIDKLEEEI